MRKSFITDTVLEKITDLIEKRLIALKKDGHFPMFCDYHGREFIATGKDGQELCHECYADGASGELCGFACDSEAIDIAEEIQRLVNGEKK